MTVDDSTPADEIRTEIDDALDDLTQSQLQQVYYFIFVDLEEYGVGTEQEQPEDA